MNAAEIILGSNQKLPRRYMHAANFAAEAVGTQELTTLIVNPLHPFPLELDPNSL